MSRRTAYGRRLVALVATLALFGCGEGPGGGEGGPDVAGPSQPALLSLDEQIQQVRSGVTDGVNLTEQTASDDDLARVADLQGLKKLAVGPSHITDAGLSALARMSRLETLSLGETPLTDAAAEHILSLETLRDLRLPYSHVSDEMLARLTQLPKLERVVFGSDRLSDAGLDCFLEMPHLKHLILYTSPVSGAGLEKLTRIETLQSLYLIGIPVSEETLLHLEEHIPHVHLP